jgi:hypothetical protein
MKFDGSVTNDILNKMPLFLDYELLVSIPGIAEPDSGFMWGSNFRAPVGISLQDGKVSFNLFLPAKSEREKSISLFFNRVGAKFQDGLWQVRRDMSELSTVYENVLNLAVSGFPSVVLDYSFIEEGRYFAHFIFNSEELPSISGALVSFSKLIPGLRIEYLRKLEHAAGAFSEVSETDETTVVCIGIEPKDDGQNLKDQDFFFVMANFIENGAKIVGSYLNRDKDSKLPNILKAEEAYEIGSGVWSLKCQNPLLSSFLTLSKAHYLIVASIYGIARTNSADVLLTMPSVQMSVFLSILSELAESNPEWNLTIKEVSKLKRALL